MINASPVPDGAGWVPIPVETARDPRITRRALGLLVELLSYPSGWDNTAERLGAQSREGVEGTTGAWACLEVAGYIVRIRYRNERGHLRTKSFAGSTPAVAKGLADAWLAERPDLVPVPPNEGKGHERARKASSDRPRENHGPVNHGPETRGPSTYKESKKESKKEKPGVADAAPRQPDAVASGIPSDDADASRADAHASAGDIQVVKQAATKTAKTRPLPARLDAHLAQLDAARLDEILGTLEDSRGGVLDWAATTARKSLGLSWDSDFHEEPDGPYARKTIALALMRLRKENGGGIPPEADLDDFDWPETRPADHEAPREPRERPYTECLPYAPGKEPAAILRALYDGLDAAGAEARNLLGTEFDFRKPRIFRICEQQARTQLMKEGGEITPDVLLNLTLKYGQQRYSGKGKCPTFLVPEHLRPKRSVDVADEP